MGRERGERKGRVVRERGGKKEEGREQRAGRKESGERSPCLHSLLPVSSIILTLATDLTTHLPTPSLPSSRNPTTNQIARCALGGVAPLFSPSRGTGPTGITVVILSSRRGRQEWVWLRGHSANHTRGKKNHMEASSVLTAKHLFLFRTS